MDLIQLLIISGGAMATIVILFLALSAPATGLSQKRRIEMIRERHGNGKPNLVEQQMRRITAHREQTRGEGFAQRFIPNPALLRARLIRTGKDWTLARYLQISGGLAASVMALLLMKGAPFLLALLIGAAVGLGIPFLLVAAFFSRLSPLVDALKRHGQKIEIIMGLMLWSVGLLMLTGGFSSMSFWLMENIPFLATLG